ncbi:AL4 [Pepper huasteco yellow vein virus-[Sinaloa]]|nr:AL4 [Pepper huasteco yellow vein virus-[Sinaloa]]
MVIHNMVVHLPETPNQGLLVAGILPTSDLSIESMHNLITIPKIVLHSSGTGLVVIHVKDLAKIHRRTVGSPIPNQPKHDTVGMVLQLNIFIHPDFAQNIDRLNAESFANTMGNTITTSDVGYTNNLANMRHVMTLFKRLNLTGTFTTFRNIRRSVHTINAGLPVHWAINPS